MLGPAIIPTAKALIDDPANEKFISPASYWELAIKISTDKYRLHQPYETFLQDNIDGNGFVILPVHWRHTSRQANLPFHHRDPFDRLIISQALVEQLAVVSDDAIFDAYGVTRLW